ncbi:50S ribosomal protein L1 [Candidatus Falkowbacteria bacterium CG10_big_fil_rev_8_21_14_0_10_43_11]|uniref:Large ribosomal subunit protein uL1 n=1 Tax=Candidatus Falkowbacteria bacterium CG10_big_fil_rev_8_21_14_0_10_43_11 TaxID=1974568 RepID=A0A2M6WL11_9BACT|nr:MAG: 50S ribosomal protein L1 [Candidatus Falkowbacteria bacterium CG10_big_fil_rev_8_21_14_0_10_43_11]
MAKSKRMTEISKLVDKTKSYPIAEAVALVKKTSKVKFDANVELHAKLGIDPTKGEQQMRAFVTLPKSASKKKIVIAFVGANDEKAAKDAGADIAGGEELIKKIIATKKTDFDIAVATPEMMKVLAPAAKILGPRGLMPSPKNNTVSPNIKAVIEEIKKGKMAFKNDAGGNVHLVIGKISFTDEELTANFAVVLEAIRKAKPASSKGTYLQNVSVCSGMGPGIKIQL